MRSDTFVDALETLADDCDRTDLPDDPDDLDRLLTATSRIVTWELDGLAAQLAKVNGTPVSHPVKPAPKPQPKQDPQPPPPPPPPDDSSKWSY